jgi:hypothetical protein
MNDDRVVEALAALARHDGEMQAPPAVEARLRQQFRARRKPTPQVSRWLLAAAAGIALILFGLALRPQDIQEPVIAAAPTVQASPQPVSESLAASPAIQRVRGAAASPRQREVVTDFFPLINPAPPFERGQILRVRVPSSAMRTVGLPVREDRLGEPVDADVLVGEEGLARAIRFVRVELQ